MSNSPPLQRNRFEYKYVIDELQVRAIRSFASSYLILDEHTDPHRDNSYPVYSLYLDSPNLTLLRDTKEGLKNRFKLRIRFYDDDPQHPAFLEIKRRIGQSVQKERAAVTRHGANHLLDRGWVAKNDLFEDNLKGVDALGHFCGLTRTIHAEGRTYVTYDREAYVSPNSNDVRVTFDRNIQAGTFQRGSCLARPACGIPIASRGVVLELKFTDRHPGWMREMAHAFGLWRTSFAKYVQCAEAVDVAARTPAGFRKVC